MLQQQSDLNVKVFDLLQQQNSMFTKLSAEINKLKGIIINQNNVLSDILSKQIVALSSTFKSQFEEPKYTNIFPISSEDELKNFEEFINSENKSEIVSSIKRILGLQKGLPNILSMEIILNYNIRGIQGKKRLLDNKKFINVLFLAASSKGGTEMEFYTQLRKALKSAKNKHFKAECLKRKKVESDSDSSN